MTDAKDFRAVNPKYDQDWVNGVGDAEYKALFKFLEDKNIKSVLDLAGGSGTLTRMLMERGYDVFLFDIADNMIAEARLNGVPEEKSMAGDIFANELGKTFDCIIFKSSMHEIPLEKSAQLHSIIYDLLNPGGWFVDWDVHVPTEKDAIWFKKWVNLKDIVAGLDDLVKNRHIYSEAVVFESLKQVGFINVAITYRFFYTFSISKMCKMYWADNAEKTNKFLEETRELIKTAPSNIIIKEIDPKDIEIKVPAVFVVGQK